LGRFSSKEHSIRERFGSKDNNIRARSRSQDSSLLARFNSKDHSLKGRYSECPKGKSNNQDSSLTENLKNERDSIEVGTLIKID